VHPARPPGRSLLSPTTPRAHPAAEESRRADLPALISREDVVSLEASSMRLHCRRQLVPPAACVCPASGMGGQMRAPHPAVGWRAPIAAHGLSRGLVIRCCWRCGHRPGGGAKLADPTKPTHHGCRWPPPPPPPPHPPPRARPSHAQAELDNGAGIAALRRFNDALRNVPADRWGGWAAAVLPPPSSSSVNDAACPLRCVLLVGR